MKVALVKPCEKGDHVVMELNENNFGNLLPELFTMPKGEKWKIEAAHGDQSDGVSSGIFLMALTLKCILKLPKCLILK